MELYYDSKEEFEEAIRVIIREELLTKTILIGSKNIKKALGIKSIQTLLKYYNDFGLPMFKNPRGLWMMHVDSLKEWMTTRSLIGRKAKELGIKSFDSTDGRTGKNTYPRIERMTEEEMGRVLASIREDMAR